VSYVTRNPPTGLRQLFRVATNSFPAAVVASSELCGTRVYEEPYQYGHNFKRKINSMGQRFDKLKVAQLVRNSPTVRKPEGSLLCSRARQRSTSSARWNHALSARFFKALSGHLPRGTDEQHKIAQSRQPVSGPRSEPWAPRIQSRIRPRR
jgi:hypothetical protein